MVETSYFSDSDSMADAFDAMDIDTPFVRDNSEAPSTSSVLDVKHPLYYLQAEICNEFIEYYQTKYRRMFPEHCVPNTTDPWQLITCSADDMDELFHRITLYVGDILAKRYNYTDPDREFNFRVTKEILSDWIDLLTQRSHHELKISGQGGECVIVNDHWSGRQCLYSRLDDWVQMQAAEHGLSDASPSPPPAHNDDDDEDYQPASEYDSDNGSGASSDSVISQDD